MQFHEYANLKQRPTSSVFMNCSFSKKSTMLIVGNGAKHTSTQSLPLRRMRFSHDCAVLVAED